MLRKFLLFSVVMASIIPSINAQKDSLIFILNAGIDASQLINPIDPSILFTLEHSIYGNWLTAKHEFGPTVFVYSTGINKEDNMELIHGFKTKHGLRVYLKRHHLDAIPIFIDLDFQYASLTVRDRYTLGYGCTGFQDCLYFRDFTGNIKTNSYAYQVRFGFQSELFKKVLIEPSFGLGVRRLDLVRSSVEGGQFVELNRFYDEDKFGENDIYTIRLKVIYTIMP